MELLRGYWDVFDWKVYVFCIGEGRRRNLDVDLCVLWCYVCVY